MIPTSRMRHLSMIRWAVSFHQEHLIGILLLQSQWTTMRNRTLWPISHTSGGTGPTVPNYADYACILWCYNMAIAWSESHPECKGNRNYPSPWGYVFALPGKVQAQRTLKSIGLQRSLMWQRKWRFHLPSLSGSWKLQKKEKHTNNSPAVRLIQIGHGVFPFNTDLHLSKLCVLIDYLSSL